MSPDPKSASERTSPAEAALALGQMQLESGQAQAALESFSMAARQGAAAGLTMIGRMHERGWGVPRDPALAAGYFRRAGEAGDTWALFNLADLYLSGDGVARDATRAHDLYARAASAGLTQALNMLGMLAQQGIGPDPAADAVRYFRAGAEAGDPWAQFNLARALMDDDRAQALAWLDRSLPLGFPEYWRAMAQALADHPDPAIRQRAEAARSRVNALSTRAPA